MIGAEGCAMLKSTMLLVASLLCAHSAFAGPKRVTLTIHSSPEGAGVYANDARTYMGVTPLDLVFGLSGSDDPQDLQGFAIRWASGASAEYAHLTLYPTRGKHQTITMTRPDVPGLSADLQVALQQQEVAALQSAASAQQAAATAQQLAANQALFNSFKVPVYKPVLCSSYRLVGQIYTSCY